MNINTFEKSQQERVIEAEARGEVEVSFASQEVENIKQKIEKRKAKQRRLKVLVISVASIIGLLLSFALYSQYKLYKLTKAETVVAKEEAIKPPKTADEVIKALKRHILTPEGAPQIAEVKDSQHLRETQAFFKDVLNGDIVIVYPTTIFVYRPSLDVVVASGDISGQDQVKP